MHAVNLSALTPTLIESELFGHRRGAFTGAASDRQGWLEVCGPYGSVFLDEIGELDLAIQVKLLRVLQGRVFQRIGDTKPCRFEGKVIAATNRDLMCEMAAGRFRSDLYYRICADVVRTPTLREQLRDAPGDLRTLTLIVTRRALRDSAEEPARAAAEVERWILTHLGADYPWPGNVRELEQCVRNVLVRGEYRPRLAADEPRDAGVVPDDEAGRLAEAMRQGALTADQLLQHYCALSYAQTHSYLATARRLSLDRRTVKAHIDTLGNGTKGGARGPGRGNAGRTR
jgi:transcriptional regulator with GAF, ATPase, and Fis domain